MKRRTWSVKVFRENLRNRNSAQVNISKRWTSTTKVLEDTGLKLILFSGEEPKIAAYLKILSGVSNIKKR